MNSNSQSRINNIFLTRLRAHDHEHDNFQKTSNLSTLRQTSLLAQVEFRKRLIEAEFVAKGKWLILRETVVKFIDH